MESLWTIYGLGPTNSVAQASGGKRVPMIDFRRLNRLLGLVFFLAWQSAVFGREVPITILHTCDLHGHILPTEDYDGHTNLGGFARCATVIQKIRAENKNTLLVDAGDTFQGTEVGYLSDGRVMVKLLNALHYDAWVWGNHEFDWGLDKLGACAQAAEVPILNANLQAAARDALPSTEASRILARRQSYVLREIDGVKVGIIGLNTPGVPHWSRPKLIQGLQFVDSVETLRRVVPAVRQAGAQVLVLVCHQGYREAGDDHANQINAMARSFPELDVIIGAHTHRNFPEFKVSNVLYSQADYFGIHLGRVDLVFDTDQGKVIRRSSNTILMDGNVPEDSGVLKLAGPELDQAQMVLQTTIGEATDSINPWGAPKHETSVHNLIFDSIAEAMQERGVHVDAIIHGIFNKLGAIEKGAITMAQVWKVLPYENTLGCCRLSKSELREILEEDADGYDKTEFRGVWGLKWTFDPKGPKGHKTISLTHADGSPIADDEVLTVAFNSYDLASGGMRWKRLKEIADRPASKLVEYDLQTRQAIIDYIRKHGKVSPQLGGWWRTENLQKDEHQD